MQSDAVEPYEILCIRKNGSTFPVETSTRAYVIGTRQIRASTLHDITERKQAEEAIQRSMEKQGLQSHRLQDIIAAMDELHKTPDLDTIYRRAVEMAREKLGIERLGLFMLDPERQNLLGTYGTDLDGNTSDERGMKAPPEANSLESSAKTGLWTVTERPRSYWKGGEQYEAGVGWVVDTILRDATGEPIGVVYNDAEISGAPLDPELQDSFALYCSMLANIIERKKAEETLQESEERFRRFTELTREGLVFHEKGKILDANPSALEIFGLSSPDDYMGKSLLEFVTPEWHELILKQMQSESVLPYEVQGARKDGTVFPMETSTRVYKIGNRAVRATTVSDITQRKLAEQTLEESEARYSAVVNQANDGVIILQDNRTQFANKVLADMLGYTPEEMLGKSFVDFLAPESRELVVNRVRARMAGEDVDSVYEAKVLCKDGRIFDAELSAGIIQYRGKSADVGLIRDITGRKKAAEELKKNVEQRERQSRRLEAIIESTNELLQIPDLDTVYRRAVELSREKLGIERCGLWLLDSAQKYITGTYGTDPDGRTTDERSAKMVFDIHNSSLLGAEMWNLSQTDTPRIYWQDGQQIEIEKGWAVATNLHGTQGPLGVMYNDAQISGAALDKDLQDAFALYCSMLPGIIERKRLELEVQAALERRGMQTQLSTQVSQSIAASTNLEELYKRVVTQVKEQFGYYHTQLLRYDPVQNAVGLVVGYGEVGEQMLVAGHRMPMGMGLIGTAAATGKTILRAVLENDPDWRPNPLLPETKGEMAVPIKLGDDVLGVLDIQSNVADALGIDEQIVMEGLCGQIATAIESTRLREEMAERLREIDQLYRAMAHEGWLTYRETNDTLSSFVFDQSGLRTANDVDLTGELFANVPLVAPGGQVIGNVAVVDDPQRPISPEDQDFIQQVSEQVALALESARLFEQTQTALSEVARHAAELETVATVSATTSSVLDPDKLLQAVVDLTKERFDLYHAHIYLADEAWQTLLLAAGAGDVGREMVAGEHTIPINAKRSLVARAAREKHAVIVNDVHKESSFLPNLLLPDTQAEMAVPMIVGDELLGVFDVQSIRKNNFLKEDADIYTTLAAQVGVALQNARLYVEQAATVSQLRELDRLKSSFLANMSHELRTPLNSILGFADVMREGLDGPLTEYMENDLGLIYKNGQHLLHLINDVLDMAKIEAGRMNLQPETFRLEELIEEVASLTSTFASEKALSLFVEDGSDREVEIYADRTRIRQVMINLVNNAIKFTDKGKIAINAQRKDDHVLITVRDTGIGIPPDKLEAVFQEFIQVDTSTTRKVGGTGLGLPISRKLVEMHGGRLWAESTGINGEGSTFLVNLPLVAVMDDIEPQGR
jgi:PAS domain S-box-containing protein